MNDTFICFKASEFDRILATLREPDLNIPTVQRIRSVTEQLQQSEVAGWDSYPSASPANHGSAAGRYHQHNHNTNNRRRYKAKNYDHGRQPQPQRVSAEIRAMRDLVSNLNKLNEANFTKVSIQIHQSFSVNIDESVTVLLDRCYLQCEYLPQFVKLFHSLRASVDQETGVLKGALDNFVSRFVMDKSYLDIGKIGSATEDYSAYCSWTSRKSTTIRKHKAILAMISNGLTDTTDLHSYFGKLVDAMYKWFEDDMDSEEEVLELVIDMLSEFFRLHDDEADRHIKEWHHVMQSAFDDPELPMSVKCRFKMMDILEPKRRSRF